jgi:glycosyltransferase involved in cell wall biosynthesis
VRTFLGYIADDDIQNFFRSADVVVFPFKNTQTSGSLMLAMSYGCPVIAPRIATLPEYMDSDMGFLFDPESPGALEQALDAAARAPLPSMAVNARRRAESMRWDTMARSHLAAYQSITD